MSSDPVYVYAICLAIVVGWANAFYAVVAIWVALGRGWWFARAAVLCGLLLALLTLRTYDYARAYDLYGPFALRCVLIVAALVAWRVVAGWWRRSTDVAVPQRMTLRELLLGMVLVAVLFTPARGSYEYLAADSYTQLWRSLIWAVIALAAVLAVMLPRWWAKPLPLIGGVALGQLLTWYPRKDYASWIEPEEWLSAVVTMGLTTLWVYLAKRSGAISLSPPVARAAAPLAQPRWQRRIGMAYTVLLALPAMVLIVALRTPEPPPAEIVDQEPLEALHQLAKSVPEVFIWTPRDEAVALFDEHRDTVAEIRELIRRTEEFAQPAMWTQDDISGPGFDNLRLVRRIGWLLQAQGRLQADVGNYFEASQTFEDGYLLGEKYRGQGFLLDLLVTAALQRMAIHELAGIVRYLPTSERSRLFDRIVQGAGTAYEVEYFIERDALWDRVVPGWNGALDRLIEGKDTTYPLIRDAYDRRTATQRLLLTMLAIENFRDAHGRLPGALHELPCEPVHYQDPFSDQRLVYRLSENGEDYRLYSVGDNRIDNAGDPQLDLLLEPDEVEWGEYADDEDTDTEYMDIEDVDTEEMAADE